MEQLIERTVKAAEQHGMAISSNELAALLATVNANMAKRAISDEALEDVAGGFEGGFDFLETLRTLYTPKFQSK